MRKPLIPLVCPKGHEKWLGRAGEVCWTCGAKGKPAEEEAA